MSKKSSLIQLKTVTLHDVIVYPDAFGFTGAWCNGEPVPHAQLVRYGRQRRKQMFYVPPVRTVEEPCVWGGYYTGHYGHFLIESMMNLYAFKEHPERRIAWRSGSQEMLSSIAWQKSFFQMVGCPTENMVFVNEPTLFKDLLFPVPGLLYETWLMPEQAETFAVCHKQMQKGKKVWLSRSKVQTDNTVFTNEVELEAMLEARGWLVIHPQDLSLEEQLEAMGTAEVVMGVVGSAFHTLLLLKDPAARFIVIDRMNGSEMAHGRQFDLIAKARTDNYYVWQPPKHEAPPLFRRATHSNWPWYAFDIDAIAAEMDRRDDFTGSMEGCPGMESIVERHTENPVGEPLPFSLEPRPFDKLYYRYRILRRKGRGIKDFLNRIANIVRFGRARG